MCVGSRGGVYLSRGTAPSIRLFIIWLPEFLKCIFCFICPEKRSPTKYGFQNWTNPGRVGKDYIHPICDCGVSLQEEKIDDRLYQLLEEANNAGLLLLYLSSCPYNYFYAISSEKNTFLPKTT